MPRALIIGGRGQTGLAVGRRLLARGWEVTATTSAAPLPVEALPGADWAVFSRAAPDDLAVSVRGEFDVVIDAVAFQPEHAEQVIALRDRVGSAVVISTISVYTDGQGRSLDTADSPEAFPAWPEPIPAGWPTLPPGDGYSGGKAAVEATFRSRAPWPVTIVRPGAIYGPGSHHLREWYFIKRALDGRRRVVLPFGDDKAFQPTATINLAELVALAAAQPANRTLDCGDLGPPTVNDISRLIDGLMGVSTERIVVEGPEPAENVGNNPWAVPRSVVVDVAPAQHELGYRQPQNYGEALAGTLPWALDAVRERPWQEVFTTLARYPGDMFDYGAEDAYFERGAHPASG
jgi:nucleoside-diphosphate-sugar epimerase